MALLDDIKTALRVKSDVFDAEVSTLIDAARYDMERVGVDPNLLAKDPLTDDLSNAFAKQAVTAYCKAHFGFDNSEAERLDESYRRIVCDLMNSSANIAAMEDEESSSASLGASAGDEG